MHKLTLQIISLFFITSLGAAEMTSSEFSQKEVRFSIYEPSDTGKQQMVDIVQFAKKNYYGGRDEPVNLLKEFGVTSTVIVKKQEDVISMFGGTSTKQTMEISKSLMTSLIWDTNTHETSQIT